MSSRAGTHAKAGILTKQRFQKTVLRLIDRGQLISKLLDTELLNSRVGVPASCFLAVFTATHLNGSFCTTTHSTPFSGFTRTYVRLSKIRLIST